MEKAKEIQANLSPEHPSFIKLVHKSHVSTGLTPPCRFRKRYLPSNKEDYVFEAESGRSYNVKLNNAYLVFSRGWKSFSRSEELVENDILVFHLVEPDKFKVYIVRASSYALVHKGVKIEDCEIEEDIDQERTCEKDAKYPRFVPQDILRENIQAICKNSEISQSCKKMRKAEDKYPNSFEAWSPLELESEIETLQGSNDSSEKDIAPIFPKAHGYREGNILGGANNLNIEGTSPIDPNWDIRPTRRTELETDGNTHEKTEQTNIPLLNFEDSVSMLTDHTNSEHSNLPTSTKQLIPDYMSLQITVNGSNIEQELPFEIRENYFRLCYYQKSLLHAHFLPTVSPRLASVVISETVKITELIKDCDLRSGAKNLETWDKTLAGFEMFGMNVTFIRLRINRLLGLYIESEEKVDKKRLGEISMEKVRVDDEMERLELKMMELKKVKKKIGDEIEDIKAIAMKYKEWFSEEASASW